MVETNLIVQKRFIIQKILNLVTSSYRKVRPNFFLLIIILSMSLTAGTFTLGVANTEIENSRVSVQTGEVLSSESGDTGSFEGIDSDDVDTEENDMIDDNIEENNTVELEVNDTIEDDNDDDNNDESDGGTNGGSNDGIEKTLSSFISELLLFDDTSKDSEDTIIILDSTNLPNGINTNASLNIGDIERTSTDFKVGDNEAFRIENNGGETTDIKVTGELSEPISGGYVILAMDSGSDTSTLTLNQSQQVKSKVIRDVQPNEEILASVILSTKGAQVGDNFGTGYRFETVN